MKIARAILTPIFVSGLALSIGGCSSVATPTASNSPSPPGSLTTSGTEGTNLEFAVEADPHMDERSDAAVFRSTLAHINESRPSFLIDLGDIFMIDKLPEKTDEAIRERFTLMKSFYADLSSSIPLYFAMGNHDAEAGWDAVNAHAYREEYFPAQTDELNYYSFEKGDSLIVVLDPFSYTTQKPKGDGWGWTLGRQQYDWLVQTLSSSRASHKFVFIHHLVGGGNEGRGGVEWARFFEWGGQNSDGTDGFSTHRPGWGMPIHDLLIKYGVDAVFKGHDHFYAHQELDGITYQTLPQPSHPGSALNADPVKWGYTSGVLIGGSGYLTVKTHDASVGVEFISASGDVLDDYVISR